MSANSAYEGPAKERFLRSDSEAYRLLRAIPVTDLEAFGIADELFREFQLPSTRKNRIETEFRLTVPAYPGVATEVSASETDSEREEDTPGN